MDSTTSVTEIVQRLRMALSWRGVYPIAAIELCEARLRVCSHGGSDTLLSRAGTRKSEPNSFKLKRPNGDKDSSNGDTQDSFDIELNFLVVPVSDYNDIESSTISEILNGVSVIDVKNNESYDIFVVLPSAKDIVEFKPQLN
nr:hypothetical protein [Tanacetum cinerariifolium]